MAISKEVVGYVANLARIELQPKELKKLSRQLQDIVDFIDRLKKVNIENVAPTSHILPISNVLREDKKKKSLPSEKALANAPRRQVSSFVVPKVIE